MSSKIINAVLIFSFMFAVTKANASLIVGDLYFDNNGIQWEYVGSFDLADGPDMFTQTNITPYNGIEAAELNFGALSAGQSYALSSNFESSYLDIADFIVDHNAWYDSYNSPTGVHVRGESITANNAGGLAYDAIGDYSAFVWDRAFPGDVFNHVFKSFTVNTVVSEPSTIAIFVLALMGLTARRLKS